MHCLGNLNSLHCWFSYHALADSFYSLLQVHHLMEDSINNFEKNHYQSKKYSVWFHSLYCFYCYLCFVWSILQLSFTCSIQCQDLWSAGKGFVNITWYKLESPELPVFGQMETPVYFALLMLWWYINWLACVVILFCRNTKRLFLLLMDSTPEDICKMAQLKNCDKQHEQYKERVQLSKQNLEC